MVCYCSHYRTCGVYIVSWLMHHGVTLVISNNCVWVRSVDCGHKYTNFTIQEVTFAAFLAEGDGVEE